MPLADEKRPPRTYERNSGEYRDQDAEGIPERDRPAGCIYPEARRGEYEVDADRHEEVPRVLRAERQLVGDAMRAAHEAPDADDRKHDAAGGRKRRAIRQKREKRDEKYPAKRYESGLREHELPDPRFFLKLGIDRERDEKQAYQGSGSAGAREEERGIEVEHRSILYRATPLRIGLILLPRLLAVRRSSVRGHAVG
jgi:hypothetical protein